MGKVTLGGRREVLLLSISFDYAVFPSQGTGTVRYRHCLIFQFSRPVPYGTGIMFNFSIFKTGTGTTFNFANFKTGTGIMFNFPIFKQVSSKFEK